VPELVVVSGKGGTGKTSIVASFFALARGAAVADCDVDAADLHLVLEPAVRLCFPFSGGAAAVVDEARCTACGACAELCRFDALWPADGGEAYRVDPVSCEGCGVCVDHCPAGAIALVAQVNGQWFVSDTRHGPMAHARLGIAQENSGKLVSLVRKEGRCLAATEGREPLICDGSPGIGCPVIASVTGARLVLVVAEPTLSGLHDLERVAELTAQLGVPTAVCVNKADINPEVADRIAAMAAARGIEILGRVRYDESVTRAQVRRLSVVEHGDGPAARDIRKLWFEVKRAMGLPQQEENG
jgi:MinD superfamily P-loop ATPase